MNIRRSGRRVLAAFAVLALISMGAGCGSRAPDEGVIGSGGSSGSALPRLPPPGPPPPKATIDLLPERPIFGVSVGDASEANVGQVADVTGCRPTIVNRFVSVASGLSSGTITNTPGIPMISLEPWHAGRGPDQWDFRLRATIDGRWDAQYELIATAVVQYRQPVLIRFAHEMNGIWYPWGATNGNSAQEFIEAWRYVVDLFRQMGASNALWVWSPNILRGASSTTISQYWPGADYVDIMGVTGFGVSEPSPEVTFGPTLQHLEVLSDKPILIAETGVRADASKSRWIGAFGEWLAEQTRVIGFVWFQRSGGGEDWRFNDTPTNLELFKESLRSAGVTC